MSLKTQQAINWDQDPNQLISAPRRYPLDRLSSTIHAAVSEVNSYVGAPISMSAMCALGAASLAVQSLVNVNRGGMIGPVSLYLLIIARSGERKTSVEKYFFKPVREWQREKQREYVRHWARYEAEMAAREFKVNEARKALSTESDVLTLEDALAKTPEVVREPRLLFTDTTPEAMLHRLATMYPSGGVFSSEAGQVFGGHAMNPESIMRNLSNLNSLWDGDPIDVDRRGGAFVVENVRLTQCLGIQPKLFDKFLLKSGDIAEGSGYLARFLLSEPESTIGTRFYTSEPGEWPALNQFSNRLLSLLNEPREIDDVGGLTNLKTIEIKGDAFKKWVEAYNSIEQSSAKGEVLSAIQPTASKAGENIARLAAVQRVFEDGPDSEITARDIDHAYEIVLWHLLEECRFKGQQEYVLAKRLEKYLLDGAGVRNRLDTMQTGPRELRKAAVLDKTILELQEYNRVQLLDGIIYLHPNIMSINT